MRQQLLALVLITLVVGTVGGYALAPQERTKPGEFQTHAYGLQSCGRWTDERRQGGLVDEVYQGWVYGFVTGAGDMFAALSPPLTLRTTDSAAIRAWVDNYCAAHPLDSIAKASEALVLELSK